MQAVTELNLCKRQQIYCSGQTALKRQVMQRRHRYIQWQVMKRRNRYTEPGHEAETTCDQNIFPTSIAARLGHADTGQIKLSFPSENDFNQVKLSHDHTSNFAFALARPLGCRLQLRCSRSALSAGLRCSFSKDRPHVLQDCLSGLDLVLDHRHLHKKRKSTSPF